MPFSCRTASSLDESIFKTSSPRNEEHIIACNLNLDFLNEECKAKEKVEGK